jgi:hypothetical protein
LDEFRSSKELVSYFVRSRPINCDVLLLSQSIYDIPTTFRRNATHWALFHGACDAIQTQKVFHKQVCADVPFDSFHEWYVKCCQNVTNPHDFLWIDCEKGTPLDMKYRNGLSQPFSCGCAGNTEAKTAPAISRVPAKTKRFLLKRVSELQEEGVDEIEAVRQAYAEAAEAGLSLRSR